MRILEKTLEQRTIFIKERIERYPDYHIFFRIIEGNLLNVSDSDRIMMMMMYVKTREALSYVVDKKEALVSLILREYDICKSKLCLEESKRIMRSIKLPLDAFIHYKNKEYRDASLKLQKSLTDYEILFNMGCYDAIWANLEQNLNRVKIEIDRGEFDLAMNMVESILLEFGGFKSKGFCRLTEEMLAYLKILSTEELYVNLNYVIDSVFFKIKKKYENNSIYISKYIDVVLASNIYSHLRVFFLENRIDLFSSSVEFPKTLEAYFFGLKEYDIRYPYVKEYFKNVYKINLN
ncbi:hypothetical protein PG588_11765 [Riemerella anatipestifer]|nr:hypothetical protein [Riemerella anatipestifer]